MRSIIHVLGNDGEVIEHTIIHCPKRRKEMSLNINKIAQEAFNVFEKHLKRTPLKIVDMSDNPQKVFEVRILLEKKEVVKGFEAMKKEIILPACFQLATEVNKLNSKFNTFLRVQPEHPETRFSRIEYNNISITAALGFDIDNNCQTLKMAVGVTEDG